MSVQSSNPPVEDKELDLQDTIEILGDESEEKEEPLELEKSTKKAKTEDKDEDEDKEDEEKEEEEEDELKEIEEELEEPDESKLELMTPVRRKEILKEFPQLFKKFPYLEKAYYREQKFTEVFPTPNDAQIAADKAATLDGFEEAIMGGSLEQVLSAAKDEDPKAFEKLVDNYLPNLLAVDSSAYYHVVGNIVKDTILTMVREAKTLGENGQPLLNAADILNQFVFGTAKFTPPQLLSKEEKKDDSRERELQEREQKIAESRFEEVKTDLQTRCDNKIKATIDANIDPKGSMTDYVKKNASREAFEMLENLMEKNVRFRSINDRLWEESYKKGFDRPSTERISAAYLSTAKTLLLGVIKKARNDALKGLGQRVKEEEVEEKEESTSEKRGPIKGARPAQSGGKFKSAKDIPRHMKSIDVLMQD